MKKRTSLLIFLTFVCSLSLFAQGVGQNDPNFLQNMRTKDLNSSVDAQGSPYINETFSPIKILNIKGNLIYNGRFNAYNGEMEVKLSDNKIIALDINKSQDYHVVFVKDKKTYKTFAYKSKSGYDTRGFLVVLSENEGASLLKKEKIKFYERQKATTSYDKEKPAKFKKEKDTYYVKINNEVTYLPTKKKDLAKAFPSHSKDITSFIKKNKIKLSKEEDLVKVVDYLGTIM